MDFWISIRMPVLDRITQKIVYNTIQIRLDGVNTADIGKVGGDFRMRERNFVLKVANDQRQFQVGLKYKF